MTRYRTISYSLLVRKGACIDYTDRFKQLRSQSSTPSLLASMLAYSTGAGPCSACSLPSTAPLAPHGVRNE
jgi:hypothetical protein